MARSLNPFSFVTQVRECEFPLRLNDDNWRTWDLQGLVRRVSDLSVDKWQVENCTVLNDKITVRLYRYVSAWRAFLQPYTLSKPEY